MKIRMVLNRFESSVSYVPVSIENSDDEDVASVVSTESIDDSYHDTEVQIIEILNDEKTDLRRSTRIHNPPDYYGEWVNIAEEMFHR